MANSELFQNLRKFVRGQITIEDLERSDPKIYKSKVDPKSRGLTEISFDFRSMSNLFEVLGFHEEDINFAISVMNPSYNYNFMDPYYYNENFDEGYGLLWVFDEENTNKLIDILKVLDPGHSYEGPFDDPVENARVASILKEYFPENVKRMLDDYYSEIETVANERAANHIEDQVREFLLPHKLRWNGDDSLTIKIVDLLNLYMMTGKVWLSFKKMLMDLFENKNDMGWSDDPMDYVNDSEIDKQSVNRNISWELGKMEDKIEEFENLKEFVEMRRRIEKKFKVGIAYDLPKLKGVSFRIKDFDRENMKIDVTLRRKLNVVQKKLSEEDFYKLLYQPELFDSEFGHLGKSS